MNDQPDEAPTDKKPKNKATMDQPQEEFITADAAHRDHDEVDEEANKKTKLMPPSVITKD